MYSLDAIRKRHPDLGFCVYAMQPGGLVTLEIFPPDGEVYSFVGATEEDVLAAAFPPEPDQPAEPTASIFD